MSFHASFFKRDVYLLDQVQRRAIKWMIGLQHKPYEEGPSTWDYALWATGEHRATWHTTH